MLAADTVEALVASFSRVDLNAIGKEGRDAIAKEVAFHKQRLDPMTCVVADSARELHQRLAEIEKTEEARAFRSQVGAIERTLAEARRQDHGTGLSNRARLAKPPSELFTDAALKHTQTGRMDTHGNPESRDNDLGRDGAFDGLTILVAKLYTGSDFPDSRFDMHVSRALTRKGFHVVMLNGFALDQLNGINQFWLISAKDRVMPDEFADAVVGKWKEGMGVYVLGDNDPFYADANMLLSKMNMPTMSGNYPAEKMVKAFDPSRPQLGGFENTHVVMTGINHLFEGITVAEFSLSDVKRKDCSVILYNSRGKPMVIVREPNESGGQIIADGAFTKFFCRPDAPGSARFWNNCACYCAANFGTRFVAALASKVEKREPVMSYVNALQGVCDITFESTETLAIVASELPDPDAMTSNFALDNPLAMGAQMRGVFSGQCVALSVACRCFTMGFDPFSRKPVEGYLPIVSLEFRDNRAIINTALCRMLLGNRQMPQKAWFLFYALCEHMLGLDPDRPDVWNFWLSQMDAHVKTSPFFDDSDHEVVPLLSAMTIYGSDKGLRRLRKHVLSVMTMTRRVGMDTDVDTVGWIRQSMMKTVVEMILADEKKSKTRHLYKACYVMALGSIPTDVKLPTLKDAFPASILDSYERCIKRFDDATIFTPEHIAIVVGAVFDIDEKLEEFKVEVLVEKLLQDPTFADAWTNNNVGAWRSLLLKRFGEAYTIPAQFNVKGVPPFATPYGPSVFRSHDGTVFANLPRDASDVDVECLKKKRNAHFVSIYGANANGYPCNGPPRSAHYHLHRAVQFVMTKPENASSRKYSDELACEVANELMRRDCGFFFEAEIANNIRFVVESYLECRAKNHPEPTHGENVDFAKRMNLEVKLCQPVAVA